MAEQNQSIDLQMEVTMNDVEAGFVAVRGLDGSLVVETLKGTTYQVEEVDVAGVTRFKVTQYFEGGWEFRELQVCRDAREVSDVVRHAEDQIPQEATDE